MRVCRYAIPVLLVCVTVIVLVTDAVAGSNAASSLNNAASSESLDVPRWLYLITGGATIGASGVLATVVTDRAFIRSVHNWEQVVPTRRMLLATLERAGQLLIGGFAVLAIYAGITGPQIPTVSITVILVFAGMRAGVTMATYLFGNFWPYVNPWRAIAAAVPIDPPLSYPTRWGVWPATVGLLAFVWIETVTPINEQPAMLAAAIVIYSVLTIVGGVLFGAETWFRFVDPIGVTFRYYGAVAPLQRTDEGLRLVLPGTELERADLQDIDSVAFVVALIWELTFSGFVTTEPGAAFITALVGVGLPPLVVYALLYIGGYGLFVGAYWLAARHAARLARTYRSVRTIAVRTAPSLLAIAAGYHLAHYFGFFVSTSPTLYQAILTPLTPPANPVVLVPPGWFGGLNIAFVLGGHLVAIWVAHAIAFDLFPGRLQAIRSEYPFVAVMIGYTVISLWLISLPSAPLAYV